MGQKVRHSIDQKIRRGVDQKIRRGVDLKGMCLWNPNRLPGFVL
jgi:hypothetical protein